MKKRIILITCTFLIYVLVILCGDIGGLGTVNAQVIKPQATARITATILDLPEIWYNTGIVLKRWAPVIICGSLILSWVLLDIFRKTPEIKKWVLMVLMLKVPIFTFIFTYLYCLLYGSFNLK